MAETTSLEFSAEEIEDGKTFAGIGYLGILFLIPLLAKPENKFCRAHAKQGLVLCIAWILAVIPFIGWLWGIFVLVCMIMGLIAAFNGKYQKLPLFGMIAEKLTF
ncbi:MAG: hypothetical protein V3T41_01675 [bacterium]|jgi:uncharacterized membrane protein